MWSHLPHIVTVRRRTSLLLDRTVASTVMAWSRQPQVESVAEVHVIGGTSGTGQVTIAGTYGGAAATETVVASGAGYYRTSRTWTALAGLTTSGLDDEAVPPQLEIRAAGVDGSPIERAYTLVSGWPASLAEREPSWIAQLATGRSQDGLAAMVLAYDETWAPREGDLVDMDGGETYEVIGRPLRAGGPMTSHWAVRARRFESAG